MSLDEIRRDLRSRFEAKKNQEEGIEAIYPFLEGIPEKDKELYHTVYIGEVHPRYGSRPGFWLAVSLPGGELWLRHPPKHGDRDQDKASILHEYGHYVWYFDTTDNQKSLIKDAYLEAEKWAETKAKEFEGTRVFYPYVAWKDYFIMLRAGRNVMEAYAEAYAWYYTNPALREALREERPEMYKAFIAIERERVDRRGWLPSRSL